MPRLLILCALLSTNMAASRTLEDLESQLKRTPPVTTAFVEYRFSHLLKKPLRTSGTLEYRSDGVLARTVVTPYHEVTEVTGDQVRITRGDKPARALSLQRAPQLRVLLGSFRALLEGRLAPLQQDFAVTLLHDDPTLWTLTLKPLDAQLARHLASIEVFGRGDHPACLQALEPDGDGAITLMGEAPAATATLPTRAELERSCRAGAAHGAANPQR